MEEFRHNASFGEKKYFWGMQFLSKYWISDIRGYRKRFFLNPDNLGKSAYSPRKSREENCSCVFETSPRENFGKKIFV
jgi:hypothetical protein